MLNGAMIVFDDPFLQSMFVILVILAALLILWKGRIGRLYRYISNESKKEIK
jgi:hypothetical protein